MNRAGDRLGSKMNKAGDRLGSKKNELSIQLSAAFRVTKKFTPTTVPKLRINVFDFNF